MLTRVPHTCYLAAPCVRHPRAGHLHDPARVERRPVNRSRSLPPSSLTYSYIRPLPPPPLPIPCLQRRVRDPRANYLQTLSVLREAKACGVYTKSSIMLGLGESDDEVVDTMLDLKVRRWGGKDGGWVTGRRGARAQGG